jgi:hypothetical protein
MCRSEHVWRAAEDGPNVTFSVFCGMAMVGCEWTVINMARAEEYMSAPRGIV